MIMKKTYLMPATTVVKVKLQQMIALSLQDTGGKAPLNNTTLDDEDVVLSRRGGSPWDDEEEEDF